MHAKSLSRVRLYVTLWAIACQAPLFMGFSRQEYWRGQPCPPPRDHPDPGIEPVSLTSPALAGGFFTTSATWESPLVGSARSVLKSEKLLGTLDATPKVPRHTSLT